MNDGWSGLNVAAKVAGGGAPDSSQDVDPWGVGHSVREPVRRQRDPGVRKVSGGGSPASQHMAHRDGAQTHRTEGATSPCEPARRSPGSESSSRMSAHGDTMPSTRLPSVSTASPERSRSTPHRAHGTYFYNRNGRITCTEDAGRGAQSNGPSQAHVPVLRWWCRDTLWPRYASLPGRVYKHVVAGTP